MKVPIFNDIWDEILSKKIIQKNKQYGNSLQEPALTFNKIDDIQLLINIRLDDKLKRMEMLDDTDEKYWSEIQEIIAYMMWKLYLKEEADKKERIQKMMDDAQDAYDKAAAKEMEAECEYEPEGWDTDSDRQPGDEEQSSEDTGEDDDDRGYLRFLGLRRLPDKQ